MLATKISANFNESNCIVTLSYFSFAKDVAKLQVSSTLTLYTGGWWHRV